MNTTQVERIVTFLEKKKNRLKKPLGKWEPFPNQMQVHQFRRARADCKITINGPQLAEKLK